MLSFRCNDPLRSRSRRARPSWRFVGGVFAVFYVLATILSLADNDQPVKGKGKFQALIDENLVAVARPPFSEDVFPCSECHDGTDVDTTRREVEDHETVVFEHDAENRWCLDCHDTTNRDKLHLADGTLLDFTESYRLCGQCHGPKLRAWIAGEHGKRTGSWSGKKNYLLCAHCHDPHSPRFKPIKPLPPPIRPEDLR